MYNNIKVKQMLHDAARTAARCRKEKKMKKIIDGKRYDTDTADCVYGWDNDRYGNDFRYRSKSLYRTKNGAWFIHHTGGAMTDMAVSIGSGSMTGSTDIEIITDDDAFAFLCTHGGGDQAEKYFRDRIEDA